MKCDLSKYFINCLGAFSHINGAVKFIFDESPDRHNSSILIPSAFRERKTSSQRPIYFSEVSTEKVSTFLTQLMDPGKFDNSFDKETCRSNITLLG